MEIPDTILACFWRGFTARMPALVGYSGEPVAGADGRLQGLVSALPDSGGEGALALLSGMDLGGLTRDRERRVRVLSIRGVMEEARRLNLAWARPGLIRTPAPPGTGSRSTP